MINTLKTILTSWTKSQLLNGVPACLHLIYDLLKAKNCKAPMILFKCKVSAQTCEKPCTFHIRLNKPKSGLFSVHYIEISKCFVIYVIKLKIAPSKTFMPVCNDHFCENAQNMHSCFYEIILNFCVLCGIVVSNSIMNGDLAMPVSYDKLWKLLIDRKMNRTELKDAAGISFNVLAKMGRNEFVSMESLYKVCRTLSCNIGEIMEFIDDKKFN